MLLDTNALSAFAERDEDLLRVLPTDRPWFLPVIAVGEYRFGLKSSSKGREREAWLAGLIDVVTVLPLNETTTLHYAIVRQELKLANRQIPPNDRGQILKTGDMMVPLRSELMAEGGVPKCSSTAGRDGSPEMPHSVTTSVRLQAKFTMAAGRNPLSTPTAIGIKECPLLALELPRM